MEGESVLSLKKFNRADKVLAGAFGIFLVACFASAKFPSTATEFLLFVAEAALVGGIADWFATEALFRKPLGFPFHTAIIPNRRDELAEASVKFVEEEFFSRKKIVKLVHDQDLIGLALPYLENPETKKIATEKILEYLSNYIDNLDSKYDLNQLSKDLAEKFVRENGSKVLDDISQKISIVVDSPDTKKKAISIMQDMAQKIVGGNPMMAFLAGIATSSGVIDFDEAADLLQAEGRKICTQIKNLPLEFWREINAMPFIERVVRETLNKNLELIKNPHLQSFIVASTYDETIQRLKSDSQFSSEIEKILRKIGGRAALHARGEIAPIISKAFSKFTDADLNRIIEDKVQTDLIWIRLNGSIVGSIVGCIIFVVLKIFA